MKKIKLSYRYVLPVLLLAGVLLINGPKIFATTVSSPTITSVAPNSGLTVGGSPVIIIGTQFAAGATVTIGGALATDLTVTPTSITAKTPAGTAGAQDVVVTNTDTGTATLTGGFTYVGPACNASASNIYVSNATTNVGANPAALLTFIHPGWTASSSIPAASWIWSTDPVADTTVNTTVVFTKTFPISGAPLDSTLQIAADNTYSVSVNGNPDTNAGCVDTTGNTFANAQNCLIPASMLLPNTTNTLAITVTNTATPNDSNYHDNPAGLLYSLTVNENDCSITPTLSSIAITSPANKLTYTVGDALDITGLVVTGTYSDNSTVIEPITVGDVSGFNSSVPAVDQILTITYQGKTTTYTVTINAAPTPEQPPLDVGNPANNNGNVDTYSNFSIVDTNNPAQSGGYVVSFQYFASNTNPFEFILVDPSGVVEWVSPIITPAGTGVQTYIPTTNVPVQAGWNLGAHFDSTGTVPFSLTGAPASYTPNNNGTPVVENPLTIEGISDRTYAWNATISSEKLITSHTITASSDSNGTIDPSGSVSVGDGSDQSFTITPNSSFQIQDVLVDGSSVGTVSSYDFVNVTTDHTISASFAADENNNNDNSGGNNNNSGHHGGNFTSGLGGGNSGGSNGGNSGGGQVLGAETFKFTEWMSITKGSHASEVPQLQQRLTDEGDYSGPISGVFDLATKLAVEKYQKAHPPLKVDGVVGPKTRAVLNQ